MTNSLCPTCGLPKQKYLRPRKGLRKKAEHSFTRSWKNAKGRTWKNVKDRKTNYSKARKGLVVMKDYRRTYMICPDSWHSEQKTEPLLPPSHEEVLKALRKALAGHPERAAKKVANHRERQSRDRR